MIPTIHAGTTRSNNLLVERKEEKTPTLGCFSTSSKKRIAGPKISETYSSQGSRSCRRILKGFLSLQNVPQGCESPVCSLFSTIYPGEGMRQWARLPGAHNDFGGRLEIWGAVYQLLQSRPFLTCRGRLEAVLARRETIINSACAWGSEGIRLLKPRPTWLSALRVEHYF